jgi:hypothetical protein
MIVRVAKWKPKSCDLGVLDLNQLIFEFQVKDVIRVNLADCTIMAEH